MDKAKMFQEIVEQMYNVYIAKNADYGDSVGESVKKYGLVAPLVRIEDKVNRASTLVTKGEAQVIDEKLEDTLMDLANYSIMMLIEVINLREEMEGEW